MRCFRCSKWVFQWRLAVAAVLLTAVQSGTIATVMALSKRLHFGAWPGALGAVAVGLLFLYVVNPRVAKFVVDRLAHKMAQWQCPACAAADEAALADAFAKRGDDPVEIFRRKMFGRLLEKARRAGLPVLVETELDAAGVYVRVRGKPSHIAIKKEHLHYYVLAHEIGHHIAIQRFGDNSEEGADREGFRLIRSLLLDGERSFWEPVISAVESDVRLRKARS